LQQDRAFQASSPKTFIAIRGFTGGFFWPRACRRVRSIDLIGRQSSTRCARRYRTGATLATADNPEIREEITLALFPP